MRRKIARETVKLLAAFLILSQVLNATAATVEVRVSIFQLSPPEVSITAGDSVSWVDDDDGGYVVSGVWGSSLVPVTVQFNTAGTFPYTAGFVFSGGDWDGTVIVAGGNSLPSVTITNPANNAVFAAPATFTFAVAASDPDPNDLLDVEFWINDEIVDDVYDPPYATPVSNLAAGSYTLRAVAWDWSFATATNSITITVVNPGTIILSGAARTGGNFKFNASGLAVGKTNVVQASTNPASPSSWIPISTNIAASSTASFTNAITAGARFFRILQLP